MDVSIQAVTPVSTAGARASCDRANAGHDATIEKRGTSWKVGKTLLLTLDVPGTPVLRDGAGGKELLVPVELNGKAVLRATYEWDLE